MFLTQIKRVLNPLRLSKLETYDSRDFLHFVWKIALIYSALMTISVAILLAIGQAVVGFDASSASLFGVALIGGFFASAFGFVVSVLLQGILLGLLLFLLGKLVKIEKTYGECVLLAAYFSCGALVYSILFSFFVDWPIGVYLSIGYIVVYVIQKKR